MRTYTHIHTHAHARIHVQYIHTFVCNAQLFFNIDFFFFFVFYYLLDGIFRLTNISFTPVVRENDGTMAHRTRAHDSLAVSNRLHRILSVYNDCFVIIFLLLLLLFETHKNVTVFAPLSTMMSPTTPTFCFISRNTV